MAVEFSVYKLTKSQIDSLPVIEGQLLFATDNKKIYLDTSNGQSDGRVEFDSIPIKTESDKSNIKFAGIYYMYDSNLFYYYDGQDWNSINISNAELTQALNTKADKNHNHDDLYYRKNQAAPISHSHSKSQITDISYKKSIFTILPSEVKANDDGYRSIYPYKYDLSFSQSTIDYYPTVINDPSCDDLFVSFARANALNGTVRLYFKEIPNGTLIINSVIIQKI